MHIYESVAFSWKQIIRFIYGNLFSPLLQLAGLLLSYIADHALVHCTGHTVCMKYAHCSRPKPSNNARSNLSVPNVSQFPACESVRAGKWVE